MDRLRDKLSSVREKLLDPFRVDGLEEEFEELLAIMRASSPQELVQVKEEFEELKYLLNRNLGIISGGLEPLLNKGKGSLFSRRV